MICGAALCDELVLFLVRPSSMRPGSSAAALIQLGESAWCDEMHVLHSFIRSSVHWDLHSPQLQYYGTPSPSSTSLASTRNCCETCLGGLDRSADSVRWQLCSKPACLCTRASSPCFRVLVSLTSNPNSTTLHPALLFSSLSGPLLPQGVVIGCHQGPGDKLAALACALPLFSRMCKRQSQGRPCKADPLSKPDFGILASWEPSLTTHTSILNTRL